METNLDDQLNKVIVDGDGIAALADRAAEIAKVLGLDKRAQDARLLAQRGRDRSFQIIFAGEFNSGKSTAINSVLGESVMPTKIFEANAVLTRIRYGRKRALLYPPDGGAPEEVPYNEIAEHIVVDPENRKKKSQWKYAELYYPLGLLEKGIVIVDPPGTNKFLEREQMTAEETANSDAVVYLFQATQGLKDSERRFIESCLAFKECFWLVTRRDSLRDEEQIEEVRAALESELGEERPDDDSITSRIFFVDAYQAQKARVDENPDAFSASGMAAFVTALGKFIAGDRRHAKMSSLCARLDEILQSLDESAKSQLIDTEREHRDVVNRRRELTRRLGESRREAAEAERHLARGLPGLTDMVRRQVRLKIRSLPEHPPAMDYSAVRTPTLLLSPTAFLKEKEEIVTQVQSIVVTSVDYDLRQWFDKELAPQLRSQLAAELEIFNSDRRRFESQLSAIRAEYLELPLSKGGHELRAPTLEFGNLQAALNETIRSIESATLRVQRGMLRNVLRALSEAPEPDRSDAVEQAIKQAALNFFDRVSLMLLQEIAEMDDQLAEAAQQEITSWLQRIQEVAAKSLKDSISDLEWTAQEGERVSALAADKKAKRRTELLEAQDRLRALEGGLIGALGYHTARPSS